MVGVAAGVAVAGVHLELTAVAAAVVAAAVPVGGCHAVADGQEVEASAGVLQELAALEVQVAEVEGAGRPLALDLLAWGEPAVDVGVIVGLAAFGEIEIGGVMAVVGASSAGAMVAAVAAAEGGSFVAAVPQGWGDLVDVVMVEDLNLEVVVLEVEASAGREVLVAEEPVLLEDPLVEKVSAAGWGCQTGNEQVEPGVAVHAWSGLGRSWTE